MSLGNQQLSRSVVTAVEDWTPSEAYGHESKFQNDLQQHLDRQLNQNDPMALGPQDDVVVEREHGNVNADVAVDGIIGIEMKRNLSNSQTKKLRGQIEEYRREYDHVLAVTCGIEDMDGWRKLKNDYRDSGVMMDPDTAPVEFIHKPRSEYGHTAGTNGYQVPNSASELQSAILKTARANPDLSKKQISEHCDCSASYVSSTLKEYGSPVGGSKESTHLDIPEATGSSGDVIAESIEDGLSGVKTLQGEDTGMSTGDAAASVFQMLVVVGILVFVLVAIVTTVVL